MSEDTASIVKRTLRDASTELKFENQSIIDILNEYVDNGTLTGSKTGRVKKMADSILSIIRQGGEESED